jgi:hypothetical protein
MKRSHVFTVLTTLCFVLALAFPVSADYAGSVTKEDIKGMAKEPSYSPYGGRNFPTNVYWGDTHLHTNNSLDARTAGVTLSPEDALRFARGEEVVSTHGEIVRLSRPLDYLVVTDHSDAMGVTNEIIKGNPDLMRDPQLRDWNKRIHMGAETQLQAGFEVVEAFTQGKLPEAAFDDDFIGSVWGRYLETVEKYNEPGRFTAIIGYEWTSTPDGKNLHRNVLYRGDISVARQALPLTVAEGFDPENLWKWMTAFEEKTGSRVLALAHNGNLSNGLMFPMINPATGKPLTKEYALERIKWEPIYEVTQIKGDGEAHPYLSPNDEFADYGTWDKGGLGESVKTQDMLQYEYAREALKNGLKLESKLGVNPYKFGMVGATDAHTGLATAAEENFFGKHSLVEPEPDRWKHTVVDFGENKMLAWEQVSSGYGAVWATENTREAIFDAMKRKEVYATTGPRMTVWFFGGWDFVEADAQARTPGAVGYTKGVSMGGDLTSAPKGKAPTFLVAALKDPYSGNLDRIQVVKGWLDKKGNTHEKVYDVAWSDTLTRKPGADGKVPPVGNTVDVKNATWTNTIGDPELITVWEDPDFDPDLSAFYYARVIEIPTPRWTAYDAKRYSVKMSDDVRMTTQERAYTSPIWYAP